MKVSKNRYLQAFAAITIMLALYRCAVPEVAQTRGSDADAVLSDSSLVSGDTITTGDIIGDAEPLYYNMCSTDRSRIVDESPHPIYSVPRFQDAFPDSQAVHLVSARKLGVSPVVDRRDAETRKSELVYVGANPYFYVEELKNSVPYLVPRASELLNDIGRSFFDSLYVKGIPLHKIIVTSVLRTKADVDRLRHRNNNATENSCHLYGTTVDISQNRYQTVQAPGEHRRMVSNDTLKWVLSEVLRDFREQNRCYIKYEVKQGCFHVTVR